jgi:hypothetical protein
MRQKTGNKMAVYLEFLRISFASFPATAESTNRKLAVSYTEKREARLAIEEETLGIEHHLIT